MEEGLDTLQFFESSEFPPQKKLFSIDDLTRFENGNDNGQTKLEDELISAFKFPVDSIHKTAKNMTPEVTNLSENSANLLSRVVMIQLRNAVTIATQYGRHERSEVFSTKDFKKATEILHNSSIGEAGYFDTPKIKYLKNVNMLFDRESEESIGSEGPLSNAPTPK